MEKFIKQDALESVSLDAIDSIEVVNASKIIDSVESNTKWEDTSKHITHNGSSMNC